MIDTVPLFAELGKGLMELLSSLSAEDWRKPTVHADRDVKDLASHLLDTALRRLAIHRDGFYGAAPSDTSFQGLVRFIQQMNREWMDATRRLSPRVLVELSTSTEAELAAFFSTLAPHDPAPFSVAWAGETTSETWFDVAREYTERWHHQQQIRDAVGKPGFTEPKFIDPVIQTFVRGLPHAYRDAPAGSVRLEIDGAEWTFSRDGFAAGEPSATIRIDSDTAWRLWTKGLSADAARRRAHTSGPAALVAPLFSFVAIMA
jgi:uncharacterized protein (TIGR03083 family)